MLTGLAQILLTRNTILTFVHLFFCWLDFYSLALTSISYKDLPLCKKLGEALYRFVLAKVVILLDAICP